MSKPNYKEQELDNLTPTEQDWEDITDGEWNEEDNYAGYNIRDNGYDYNYET